jgi:hypothetical protein
MMGHYRKLICPETDRPCESSCKSGLCAQRTEGAKQAQTVKALPTIREQAVVRGVRMPR